MIQKRTILLELLFLVAITAAGVWLRFHQLGREGIWLDESFSWYTASLNPARLFWHTVERDQHPPLYYGLLHFWLPLGEGEWHDRSLSALFSAGAIPPIYLAGRRLFGVSGAVVAAILLCVAPFQIRYAQEMRMYAMLTFHASVAIAALTCLVTGDHRLRWWSLFVLFAVLTMFSHNTAVLFVVAANVAFFGALLVVRVQTVAELRLPRLRQWLLAQGAILLLWLPWLPFFVRQVLVVDDHFWIPAPTRWSILDTVMTLFSWRHPGVSWLLPLIVGLLLLSLAAAVVRPATVLFLVSLVAVPFALELLASLRRPIFYDRTLIWTMIPLILLLAGSVAIWLNRPGVWKMLAAPAAVGLLLLLYANGLSLQNYYSNYQRENWSDAAEWVAGNVDEGHIILFHPMWNQDAFNYYFSRFDSQVPMRGVSDADVEQLRQASSAPAGELPPLVQDVAGYNCIWLVSGHVNTADEEVLTTLRSTLAQAREETFAGPTVYLFQRTAAVPCATN